MGKIGRLQLLPIGSVLLLLQVSLSSGGTIMYGRAPFLEGFRAVDLNGTNWDEESLQGKVVLIEFWATWCGPCLEEVPQLKKIYEEFHPKGFEIIGVSLDTAGRRDLERWLRRLGLPWPQVADFRGYSGELALKYGVKLLPASFLVGRSGGLAGRNLRGESLRAMVAQLCEEAVGEPVDR